MAVDAERQPAAELVTWLSALRELSSASTSAGDLRQVLDLVADTARSLLGYDFCGVLTPDAAGEALVIMGWSGLSDEYVSRVNTDRPVRLGSGSPSSQAFETGQPVAIRDIDAEAEFTPWGGVAREQGYRAIICVPLVAGEQVLGTLNGYYAPVHTFTGSEVERLTLLANHAAIALTSASRLDQLRQLNESLREQRDALTRSEQIHERLLSVTLRSGGLSGIAAVIAELIGRAVLIDDARNVVLAAAGDAAELPDDDWRAAAVVDGSVASAPVLLEGLEGSAYFVSVARLGDDAVARIWFPRGESALDPVGVRAVEHASIVISLELLRIRTAAEVEHRLRGELLAELFSSGPIVSEQLLQRAQRLGHDPTRPHVVVVGSLGSADEPAESRLYQRSLTLVAELAHSRRPRPLTAMHRGNVVTLWPADGEPGDDAAELIRRAMGSVSRSADATVAVSAPGEHGYGEAYRMAKGALDIAMRAGRTNTVVRLEELGVLGLLLQLEDSTQLVAFAGRTLGPLLDYDAVHRTDLVHTLRTHFACKLDRSRTAGALHIHPNTVTQRLRRIEQLCGVALADPAVALQFSAALTVLDVASV
ncbi:GAF domain-containing protein [Mycobacterium sp. AT1]|uniref:helix-turn-helix domain-containing protein n=1 Tax=Mycobacterium sp. AT1 TaxID=1961706 RepID=UPI0009AEC4E8|nr:GAF domain-containing protein [Mycobacterium sp. AT1]OPX10391.1 diguanylate cyclase [Mycobacterium sp. AT1]